jgi:hypothetical protein
MRKCSYQSQHQVGPVTVTVARKLRGAPPVCVSQQGRQTKGRMKGIDDVVSEGGVKERQWTDGQEWRLGIGRPRRH